ncbi:MAG: rhomboid family intramembrane serine protease [Proteobacteria bacterium]|nr:rhomboid family intramembrane serine protease [Pseudomonadota bacterium]
MRQVWINADTKLLRLGGRPPRTTLALLGLQAAIFLLYVFADGPAWVRRHLALSAAGVFGRHELWQPITALVLHLDARTLLVDLAVLWLLGAALERAWGGGRFRVFYLASGTGGLAAAALVGLSRPSTLVCGATGATLAILLASAVVYAEHLLLWGQATLGLRVRPAASIVGGALLLLALLDRAWLDLSAALAGAAIGACFLQPFKRWGPRHRLRSVGSPKPRPPRGPNRHGPN